MAEFGELLGAILASVAHARRLADEETAALAEQYRSHPLLEGMAVPRFRIPEMTLDLPVIIESHTEGDAGELESPTKIRNALVTRLNAATEDAQVELPAGFEDRFKTALDRSLSKVRRPGTGSGGQRLVTESIIRAAEAGFRSAKRGVGAEVFRTAIARDTEREVLAEVRDQAERSALKRSGTSPAIDATILTTQVKERTDPLNVTRLKLVIREEGVEWASSEGQGGDVRRHLAPE